jgi:hypothetical protein
MVVPLLCDAASATGVLDMIAQIDFSLAQNMCSIAYSDTFDDAVWASTSLGQMFLQALLLADIVATLVGQKASNNKNCQERHPLLRAFCIAAVFALVEGVVCRLIGDRNVRRVNACYCATIFSQMFAETEHLIVGFDETRPIGDTP